MRDSVTTTETRVFAQIARLLDDYETECIFGYLGEDTAPIMVAAEAVGLRQYIARHENQAVAMADGYARAGGRIGVVILTGGPGFTNALTAINTACRARSGVVVLVGCGRPEEDDLSTDRVRSATVASWLKYFPQRAVCREIGIEALVPLVAEDVVPAISAALARARHREVAVVLLGRDLLLERCATPERPPEPRREHRGQKVAGDGVIAQLADLLQQTWAIRRPVVLAGRGAVASGAMPSLRRLGELIGALLVTSLPASGLFREDPFNAGVCGSIASSTTLELIARADCVIVFGASFNQHTTYDNALFQQAMLIHVDDDPAALGRFREIDLAIESDACICSDMLVAELERRKHRSIGYRTPETAALLRTARSIDAITDLSSGDRIDPRTLLATLNDILPTDRIHVIDGGQQGQWVLRYFEPTAPQNLVHLLEAGSIGLALGAGLGAAIARPNDMAVVSTGDAALMMSLGELETAVRYNVPVLVIVTNDGALSAEVNVLADLNLSTTSAKIPAPSFDRVAASLGVEAIAVRTRADLETVRHRLLAPLRGPLLLDCYVEPTVRP